MHTMQIDDDDDDDMEISVAIDENMCELVDTVRLRNLISKPVHKHMITHVVWPRYLPSKDFPEANEHNTALIALMTDTLEWFETTDVIPNSTSRLFRGMYNMRTSDDAQTIASEINRLNHGEMLGIFVQQQNCGVSIYLPPPAENLPDQPKVAIVSTFPVCIPNDEIYAVKHSDFQVEFPTQSIKVEFSEMLNSAEFSHQLWNLNRNEMKRDNSKLETNACEAYVSQWLLPMLSTSETTMLRKTEFPMISKKIRDDVIGVKSQLLQPFRRSTYWTFLKVMLQINMTVEFGEIFGKIIHKLVLLKLMAILCNYYNTSMYSSLNIDVVLHMLAKLARRIEKLNNLIALIDEECPHKLNEMPNGFEGMYNNIIDEVKLVIFKVRQKLDDQIEQIQSIDENNSKLVPLSGLNFEADVRQQLPTLREYLEKRNFQPESIENNEKLKVKLYIRHLIDSLNAPDAKVFNKLRNPLEISIFLCDFENWILYALNDIDQCDPEDLRSVSFAYLRLAEPYYNDDQLGLSRIVLTQMKILTMLDKIAIQKHEMLKKHRPGINDEIFDHLLLPHYEDFEIAHDLKKYFRKRSQRAKYPSLLEEEKVTADSFSARFAGKSSKMKKIGERIQESADERIAELLAEWEARREEVTKLKKKLETMDCEYFVNANGKRQHKSQCACCKLKAKVTNFRVSTFEKPLPADDDDRNAVLFELRIPIEIACLRDVLYEAVRFLNEPAKKIRVFEKWIHSNVLEEYNNSESERVFLGTTAKGISVGHTKNTGIHPDQPFESCTVDNIRNCTIFGSSDGVSYHIPLNIETQSLQKHGTFTVESGSPYETLQWTLEGTNHTQNEVIARQFECPQSLTLCEYKNFGSLRADGHRLQLRKLYAMIETESLSFETQSVQSLIMQTLWEVGPSNPLAVQWNESHEDFTDPIFARAMVDLIDKFICTQKCNWKHPLKLIMTALIAARIFEMNDDVDVADRIVQLFIKLRDIAFDWIAKVQTAMQETEDKDDVEKLRMNLVEIAVGGALTFFVHFRHMYFEKIFIGSIMNSITAVRFWLHFLVIINENILLSHNKNGIASSSQVNQKMFQRLVHRIGVQIESKVRNIIVNDPSDLFEFIKSQWCRSTDGVLKLKLDQKYPETLIISTTLNHIEHFVQIGIITGEFLVNNLPVSRLPNIITEHPLFQRVFEEFIFEVHQESAESFCTKYKHRNCYYSFYSSHEEVIITERKINDEIYELIPENIFEEEIPFLLVENHSHWWSKARNIIEFRPIHFSDPKISLPEGVQYELDLNKGRLIHVKTKNIMLDVTSGSYLKIVNRLSRLESKKFINVFMIEPQIAKIELCRMNIKFLVDASNQQASYDIISNEFDGMRISSDQKCGTLYGLRQGLLLESVPNENVDQHKLMILPHGKISARVVGNHEVVEIHTESTLRSPPFFTYQIDEICQQLKASNRSYSAWFYLAYLHALTSHGQPEPFTEMSGTERALRILQSGFAWSSAPYDEESLATLKLIGKLAPNRKIKKNLQTVRWPDIVDAHAAQDSFILITRVLLADSKRLEELHLKLKQKHTKKHNDTKSENAEAEKGEADISTDLEVNIREYFRCLPYFPNLQITKTFVKHQIAVGAHHVHKENDQSLTSTRKIANLYHQNTFKPPQSFNLLNYLTEGDVDLKGSQDISAESEILDLFSLKNVRDVWISLYNIARSGQYTREKLALVLGLLSYENNNVDDFNALLLLQTVAANQSIFNGIDPPEVSVFYLNDRSFNYATIERILEDYTTDPEHEGRYNEMREIRHTIAVREYIHQIVSKVRGMWPSDRVDPSIYQHTHPNVNLRDAVNLINKKFRDWTHVQQLLEFLQNINIQIRRLNITVPNINDELKPWCPEKLPIKNLMKFYIDFDAKIVDNLPRYEDEVDESEQIFMQPQNVPERSEKDWWYTYKMIASPNDAQHLIDAGMYPRLVLSTVLRKLLTSTQNPKLKAIICAVGVQIVHEQRKRRIAMYSQKPEMKASLEQELENEPHSNWFPYEYPEWLLFEIEQDLTIRPIQINVAKHMLNPPEIGTKHSVMQLNMGEGKTSVIVPILAAILANGQQVCQVTVLKSLFATNLKELRQRLGGMLNRRVYIFPCRRDMPINKYVEKILDIYVECRRLKGVILTLPEYRLSFQLKIYETPSKDEMECAKVLLRTHKWLNQNVRNILDESDAILQPKYQLIYTLGEQLSLDGGAQRWTVIQALLKQLPYHLKKMWEHYGDEKIEFDNNYTKKGQVLATSSMSFRSDVFTPCRILDNYIYHVLKTKLIDDFLGGKLNIISAGIPPSVKQLLKFLLNDGEVSADAFNELFGKLTTTQQTTVLILNGFFRFDILQLVLNKRWRVNYGVNENGPRQMAIPFKAKDVAAEMTEFGHPDVAICLTQLSYYYSGLSEAQLYDVFKTLEQQQNSGEIYEGWIRSVPHQLVDESIQSYTGVNLSDPKQRNELVFPLFKHNMYVIDYWLSNLVFPREAKTFEHKLMCTAWDLVSDNLTHTVSGFSGTNDTKNILPLPITQNDLKELEQTNDNVRTILLRDENCGYNRLPANVRGLEILMKLSKANIPVLLDAGACMLELNNEQVARQWLNFVEPAKFDATVYFNSNDVLMTVDRNGIITEFDYSVYRNKLDRCLVYLDDVHTRGTDLKFPLGWKACVTLSGDITRDKTVQACMRMRLLGKGHSIVFVASYEADVRIRDICELGDARPSNKDVIKFICHNSRRFEEENTVHWSSSAFNYTKKLVAHKLHDNSEVEEELRMLHLKCKDNEFVTLIDMYGIKEAALLTQIATNQFDKMADAYKNNNDVMELIKSMKNAVHQKLTKQAPQVQRFTQSFDEEQEKELEHEVEEQRQVERPPPAVAAIPIYDDLLENIITSGATTQSFRTILLKKGIMSLDESLLDMPLYEKYKNDPSPWADNLYVTKDCVRVVEDQSSDEFLRPIWWIAHISHRTDKDIFVLLSSYETNNLLPSFRKSTRSALLSYRPRLSQSHSNLLHDIHMRVSGMDINSGNEIDVDEEAQLALYSGSMYFTNEVEQNAYCGFMGLIPNPRVLELEVAYEEGIISANSYVESYNRRHSNAIARWVRKCKFTHNPVELSIKLIEAHQGFIRKESHVAAILEKGMKMKI